MNVDILTHEKSISKTRARMAIADCDIHPSPKSVEIEIFPFLSKRWQEYMKTYGVIYRQGFPTGPAFPKGQPNAARRDSYPTSGGKPGSDLAFMQSQHLGPNNIQLGVLNPLQCAQGVQNQDFSAAYCNAVNQWQIEQWTSKDHRLKASLMVPYEDPLASVKEIEKWAGNEHFIQVLLLSRTAEPLGQRKYWPIYDAACRAGLPVAVHAFGYGGAPVTGGGWPSFYIEEMVGHAQNTQSLLTSMVIEGVFEKFPTLKLILVEAGFAWLPALSWRLDKLWDRMRDEIPHVSRPPSQLIREHVWLTTQPMEEPEKPNQLLDTIEWIGWENLLFATDYPHWDYDDPSRAMPIKIEKQQKEGFFLNNALKLYGLDQ